MTKRYSDTLRERAELAHNEWTTFSDGYSAALVHVADELDSPEFSGRIVYEQRNAALEDAKRWEAEAKEWKRLCLELESQILVDLWGHQVSSELTERFHAIRVKQHGPDETNAEDDNG